MPICQNARGYFYARELKDLYKFIARFEKKVRRDQEELNALRQSINFLGEYDQDKFVMMVDLPIRTDANTVRLQRFECDMNGMPKIPEGIIVMR